MASSRMLLFVGLTALGLAAHPPEPQATLPAAPPTARADVGRWDAELVKRAANTLATPAQWNRADTDTCRAPKTFSISCALQKALEEAAGIRRDSDGKRIHQAASPAECRFDPAGAGLQGTCGSLFDELPVFTISRVKAVTTGRWRADAQPDEVWAGTMSDAEYPVMAEATKTVGLLSTKKYDNPLKDYNNDPGTTFADVQAFFQRLQDRVVQNAAGDMAESADDVEIEVYAEGTGVIRTYAGWYPVSGAATVDGTLRFQMDAEHEVPPNGLDRDILQRADAIIASDAVWNRADNRKCPPTATTWSIYCAEERASIEVTGGFHHRRPALEIVRQIVDDRTQTKKYQHRLMGYNNDPSTRLEDVRTLFAYAIARIK